MSPQCRLSRKFCVGTDLLHLLTNKYNQITVFVNMLPYNLAESYFSSLA
jgi:hypothetical protein